MNSILHLKYAVEVEKTGSISKAAENLYMSQPHLSKAIRDLEDGLGAPLFDRSPRGVVPTEKGREFLLHAKNILSQVEQMERLYKPGGDGKLRFSLCAPRASYAAHAFAEFAAALDERADIALSYRETNSVRAIRLVGEGGADLAVVRYQKEFERNFLDALAERELRHEAVFEFSCLALMSAEHPLAREAEIEPGALEPYTELIHGDNAVPALPASEARKFSRGSESNRTIAVFERASQLELLSRIPTTYMLVSPMPREVLERFSLVQKPCGTKGGLYKDVLISRAGYSWTDLDMLFKEKLQKCVQKVAQP